MLVIWCEFCYIVGVPLQYYLSQISPQPTGNNTSEDAQLKLDSDAPDPVSTSCVQPLAGLTLASGEDDAITETDVKDLFVVVDNPEKHTTAMESYITFRVTTKVCCFPLELTSVTCHAFSNAPMCVWLIYSSLLRPLEVIMIVLSSKFAEGTMTSSGYDRG